MKQTGTSMNTNGQAAIRCESAVESGGQKWWKEPLMWLVLGLPASVVVAGIWTIILATRSMP